jgi:methylthioribose-1-phosphate isomerase
MLASPYHNPLSKQRMEGLQAIKYERGKLEVLDQLRLPHEFVYDNVSTSEEAFDCIKSMRVRGTCRTIPSAAFDC